MGFSEMGAAYNTPNIHTSTCEVSHMANTWVSIYFNFLWVGLIFLTDRLISKKIKFRRIVMIDNIAYNIMQESRISDGSHGRDSIRDSLPLGTPY